MSQDKHLVLRYDTKNGENREAWGATSETEFTTHHSRDGCFLRCLCPSVLGPARNCGLVLRCLW